MESRQANATVLLGSFCGGDAAAEEALFPMVYDRLRRIAAGLLAGERGNHTLQPTALVHEAWVSLIDRSGMAPDVDAEEAKGRFIGLAAHAMRRVLVDHARRVGRIKRGGDVDRATLSTEVAGQVIDQATILDLEAALASLADRSERVAKVAELRLFGGLSSWEISRVLSVSETTATDDWALARAILGRSLQAQDTQ